LRREIFPRIEPLLEHKVLCSNEEERALMRLENEWSRDKKFAQRRTPPNRISRDRVQCVDSHNDIGETIGLP